MTITEMEARHLIYHTARRHFPDWPAKDFDYVVELFFELAMELSALNTRKIEAAGHGSKCGLYQIHSLVYRELKLHLSSKGITLGDICNPSSNIEAFIYHVRWIYERIPKGCYILKEKLFLAILGTYWPFREKMLPALQTAKKEFGVIDGGMLDMPANVEGIALQLRHLEIVATHRTQTPKSYKDQTPTKEEECKETNKEEELALG